MVKWSDPAQNFCYLKLADEREAFLHRDDFDGNWPPRRMHTVLFSTLIESNHPRCKWRAKDAIPPEAL